MTDPTLAPAPSPTPFPTRNKDHDGLGGDDDGSMNLIFPLSLAFGSIFITALGVYCCCCNKRLLCGEDRLLGGGED